MRQGRLFVLGILGFCVVGATTSSTAKAQEGPVPLALDASGDLNGGFVQLDLHGAFLSDVANSSDLQPAFGYALRGGYRISSWAPLVEISHNMWVATELDLTVVQGALNIGFGLERTYFHGMAVTSFVIGPSILLFDTPLDDPGSVGLFFEVRPIGLRFQVHERMSIGLDPLTLAIVAPVLDGVPLVQIQFRTAVNLEVQL